MVRHLRDLCRPNTFVVIPNQRQKTIPIRQVIRIIIDPNLTHLITRGTLHIQRHRAALWNGGGRRRNIRVTQTGRTAQAINTD